MHREERAHMLTPAAHSTRLKETLIELGYLTIIAIREPSLFRDAEWRDSAAAYLSQLRQLVQAVHEIEIPESFRDAQTLYSGAIRKYGEVCDLYENLLATLDQGQLRQILSRVNEGNQYLSSACHVLEETR